MRNLQFAFAICLISTHALAFDCNSAKSDVEKAICSDVDARNADEALANSFNQLRASLPEDEKTSLRLSQLAWIHDRDSGCHGPRAIQPLSKCLAEKTRERQKVLEGKPEVGDTAGIVARPMFIYKNAAKGRVRLSIESIRFIGDGAWQPKINREIEDLVKKAIDESDVSDSQEHPSMPDKNDYVELTASFSLATSRLISVYAVSGNYLGQAHPDHSEVNINFDIQAGRELKFEDLLDKANAKHIFEYCRAEIAKDKREGASVHGVDGTDDVDLDEVENLTGELRNWQFGASNAKIGYDAYAFGGYGAYMCQCTVPYTMLRPLAKKEFPLP